MTNLLKFPNARRTRETAALWIARIDRELSEKELRDLQLWLAESPRHREAFGEAARLWDRMDVLTTLSRLFPLEGFEPAAQPVRWQKPAAVAAGIAFIGFFLLRSGIGVHHPAVPLVTALAPPEVPPAAQSYRTSVGQQTVVSLSDGTRVRLNTDSLIEVSYRPDSRRVHLVRGEALFEVAKDASRPFDVRSGGHIVRAVGTAFNVRVSGASGMEVTVTEGRVRLLQDDAQKSGNANAAIPTDSAPPATAAAGQLVTYTSGGESRVRALDPQEISDRTAWQRGVLVFRGEPLRDVLKEFSRYTEQKFVPNDDAIGDIPVGGYYRVTDVQGLLNSLHENFGLQTWLVGDTVMIARSADGAGRN